MTGTILPDTSGASGPLTITSSPCVQEAADLALCLQPPAESDAVLNPLHVVYGETTSSTHRAKPTPGWGLGHQTE